MKKTKYMIIKFTYSICGMALVCLLSSCATIHSGAKGNAKQTFSYKDGLVVDSQNVYINNVLSLGKVIAAKDLFSEDVNDSLTINVPLSEILNPHALTQSGSPLAVRIPKRAGASEDVKLAVVQKIKMERVRVQHSTNVFIGNIAETGGAESEGTIVAKLTGVTEAKGTNAQVSSIALPSQNVYFDQKEAEAQSAKLGNAPILKSAVLDTKTGQTSPAFIPIPKNLVTQKNKMDAK